MNTTESAPRTTFAVLLLSLFAAASSLAADILPKPVRLEPREGFFVLDAGTRIAVETATRRSGQYLAERLRRATGLPLPVGETAGNNTIDLTTARANTTLGDEGYEMDISSHAVVVRAPGDDGVFHGIQTLLQLLPPQVLSDTPINGVEWKISCLRIEDRPRFPWRGLMLDCSRTFQSLDYLRKTIDRMAAYKMNVLHLHLTDDQGWRLEIKKYPELTRKGARFAEKYHEPAANQGFYTQAEMKELIEYARQRHVEIVPEIEEPGHSLAALACYPQLSCTGGPFEIFPNGKGPGILQDIFCAGNDATFEFLNDVFAEVAAIFPSKFVHIGGDEAPKDRWKACPKCQARIKAEGLKNEAELQAYVTRRVEKILAKYGKRLIGWDEIIEGGLAPNAAVMSWRGAKGGVLAAKAGHDVVMSPTSHCYFDYTYTAIDSERAYSYEPVPAELTPEEAKHVLGLQANFWSHIDRTPDRVDQQLFPRLLSLAERGWSPKEVRDWNEFQPRLDAQLPRLAQMGVHYRPAPVVLPGPKTE